jgi:hypothetical protein
MLAHIVSISPQPQLTGTVATPNRFHDDKNTYTGVYKAGGPTTVDHNQLDLAHQLDRSVDPFANIKRNPSSASGSVEDLPLPVTNQANPTLILPPTPPG